jgi:DNA-binding MarR family transcriptional regulator
VPRAQRARRRTLEQWIAQSATRAEGLRQAYREGGMTMTAIATDLDLSVSRVSRLIAVAEVAEAKGKT